MDEANNQQEIPNEQQPQSSSDLTIIFKENNQRENSTKMSCSPNNPTNGKELFLNFEMHRLLSFPLYSPDLNTKLLAASGFFLTSDEMFIQCYFCETKILLNINIQDKELSTLHEQGCTMIHADADNDNVPIQDTTYYKYEAYRLYTFLGIQWISPVSQYLLAQHGFYWIGPDDNCRCTFCRLEIRGWEPGDTPWGEHQRWNPACRYHNKFKCGNVSIGDELKNIPQSADNQAAVAECLSNPFATNWEKIILGNTVTYNPNIRKRTPVDGLGMGFFTPPKKPEFITMNKRMDSFKFWPISLPQKPQDLSESGFYYTGVDDRVICFQCGGGLKDWSENDKPWIEHASWFPTCSYLLNKKGKTFIEGFHQYHLKNRINECGCFGKDAVAKSTGEVNGTFTPGSNKMEKYEPTINKKFKKSTFEGDAFCGNCNLKYKTIVNLPCGHIEYCEDCIRKDEIFKCKKCKKNISAYVQAIGNNETLITPAKHPEYISMDKRMGSYKMWPIHLPQKPADLAKAGFIYTGVGDRVICFQCGGGLKDWHENENAWAQHAIWYPKCSYLQNKEAKQLIQRGMIEQAIRRSLTDILAYNHNESADHSVWLNRITLIKLNMSSSYPDYMFSKKRLGTLQKVTFNNSAALSAKHFAICGFFYDEKAKCFICFCCASEIKDLLDLRDPRKTHKKSCFYFTMFGARWLLEMKNEIVDTSNALVPIQCREETRKGIKTVKKVTFNKDESSFVSLNSSCVKCIHCNGRLASTANLPCNHVEYCLECTIKNPNTVCSFCKGRIIGFARKQMQ